MPESASSRFLSTVEGDVFMMQKGQHDQSKVNVAYSYASEQGLQQKEAAPKRSWPILFPLWQRRVGLRSVCLAESSP